MYVNPDGSLAGVPTQTYPTWPTGTWPEDWSPGDTGYDPELAGIFGFVKKVVSAPFKAAYKVGKTVVRVAPSAAVGFLTAGPAGAAVAAGSRLLRGRGGETLPAPPDVTYGNVTPYAQQYPTFDAQGAANAAWVAARAALAGRAGQYIASTPEGRSAIRETVQRDATDAIKPFIIPAALGVGALILVLSTRK